ncbi:MAG: A24 family peptidase [Acidobacteriota bacterium]|nr:A24 family peptidase [Acidobacteriota bacterium]
MLVGLVAIAAIYDLRFRRIPNWLNLAGLVCGLAVNSYLSGLQGLGRAGLGLALGFLLYFPLFLLHARGAGDVKLLAAIGSITGPGNCFAIFIITAILGGVVAIVLLLIKGRLRKTLWNITWILRDLSQFRAPYSTSPELDVNNSEAVRLPHAAVIALGTLGFFALNRS